MRNVCWTLELWPNPKSQSNKIFLIINNPKGEIATVILRYCAKLRVLVTVSFRGATLYALHAMRNVCRLFLWVKFRSQWGSMFRRIRNVSHFCSQKQPSTRKQLQHCVGVVAALEILWCLMRCYRNVYYILNEHCSMQRSYQTKAREERFINSNNVIGQHATEC